MEAVSRPKENINPKAAESGKESGGRRSAERGYTFFVHRVDDDVYVKENIVSFQKELNKRRLSSIL